jgi:polyisoprenoid-binding protein YceI
MKLVVTTLLFLTGILTATCADASCWTPVPKISRISFDISQAGASLEGTFSDYSGQICLDSGSKTEDRIKVQISMASVDTRLPELDEALRGTDFFDVTRWPEATFESDAMHALGKGHYEVQGKLTLRDVTRNITVPFLFQPGTDGNAKLTGQLNIQRLDYHIGQGQWADTRWVGNQVNIAFSVILKPLQSH